MLITVFCAPRDRPETTFALDVSPELELRDFVALCELESGIPAGEIQILYTEQPLKDLTRALGNYGVKDGDVVVLRQADRRPPPTQPAFPGLPRIDFRSITVPGSSSSGGQRQPPSQQQQQPPAPVQLPAPLPLAPQPSTPSASRASGSGSSLPGLDDPALLQQMLLTNPHELSLLKERNPPLAEALLSGDLERFTKVLVEQQQDRARREQERIRLLTADPFDLEAQAKIEEDIRQHNVEENMTIAMEEAPESFGQVVMLYINCIVNGHPVKAFVDSGAQMTIMSQACAERCNIMRLVDRRWAGIAKGVGTQKIIGRVHLAQVQIEGIFLPCSFSILEDQPMDMLLGLDMLKRHQCSIDLNKNVLLIGTTGTETLFLPEAELPECARLAYGSESREDTRPEEMADRELAEALQRSIQESDTADGQTTSPKPPPFPWPTSLDQPPLFPSSSGAADGLPPAPDCTQRAPPPEPCQDPPVLQGPSGPLLSTAEATAEACDHQALPPAANPTSLPPSFTEDMSELPPSENQAERTLTPAEHTVDTACDHQALLPAANPTPLPTLPPSFTEDMSEQPPPEDQAGRRMLTFQEPAGGAAPIEIDCDSDGMSSPGELSADQPMEQESSGAHQAHCSHTRPCPTPPLAQPPSLHMDSSPAETIHLGDPTCAEMGSPPCEAVPPEGLQPEGEHCPATPDTAPSLASALLELHQLLVSNGCTGSQDSPCPPALGLDGGGRTSQPPDSEDPNNPQPPPPPHPSAAIEPGGAEHSDDAKANHAAPAAAEAAKEAECLNQGGHMSREGLEAAQGQGALGQGALPCADACWESRAEGQEEACSGPPAEGSAAPADPEIREAPDEQREREAAGGCALATATPDSLGPPSESPLLQSPGAPAAPSPSQSGQLALGAPVSPTPVPSAPAPSSEQFPAEHLQRIQAAGFSAREAAEALEQAHGVVELALLALLARNITVPT